MVQFSLPKDSKVVEGKYFKDKTNGKNLKKNKSLSLESRN